MCALFCRIVRSLFPRGNSWWTKEVKTVKEVRYQDGKGIRTVTRRTSGSNVETRVEEQTFEID
jgi:hypothetical protein